MACVFTYTYTWGFPKIRGTFLGGPYSQDYSILGSILGSPFLGKLPHIYIYIYRDTRTPPSCRPD